MYSSFLNLLSYCLPYRDDIARAIKKLKLLGNGFAIIPVGRRRLVQSVPGELNLDHSTVLQKAEKSSFVSVGMMVTECGWTEMRARKILVSSCIYISRAHAVLFCNTKQAKLRHQNSI